MVGDSQGQWKGKTEHLADLFQVSVDGMNCRVMLSPLFFRVFGGDDRKEIWSVGAGVFIHYLLQVMVPDDSFFFSCCLGCVSQMVVFDIVFGEIKQITAGHSICEDCEKEEVTGENNGGGRFLTSI